MRAALTTFVLGTFVLLAGCAGREANPETTTWVYDKYYTCKDIRAEKDRIAIEMRNRNVEQARLESRDNDLMARTIPFLAPGTFAIQESSASGKAKTPQEIEIESLLARDKLLDGMAADRGC